MKRSERRLRQVVSARLEPDETLVVTARAWVSRWRRFHWLLAVRDRDFAVLTDRRLMLWSAGFFTRAPRRRVLAERLDELVVEPIGRDAGRRMICRRAGRRTLLLEFGRDPVSDRFSIELRDRAQHATPPAARPTISDADVAPVVEPEVPSTVDAPPDSWAS